MDALYTSCLSTDTLLPQKIQVPLMSPIGSKSFPLDYREEVSLTDGTKIVIRPICSADKTAVIAFHNKLSEESRFLRYHYSKGDLTENELNDLCNVDYNGSMALVAETDRCGHKEILGIGLYIRLSFDHTAEVAFAVQDNEQNKGIGTQLLKHLSILARQRDIHYFFGEVLRQNGKMLSVFRKSDPEMKQEVDGATTCTVTISLEDAMSRVS